MGTDPGRSMGRTVVVMSPEEELGSVVIVRVEVVTPCGHGEWNPHRSGDGEITASSDGAEIMAVICRGASRKAFTEWPPEAIEAMRAEIDDWLSILRTGLRIPTSRLEKGLAAAWGHITGDNK